MKAFPRTLIVTTLATFAASAALHTTAQKASRDAEDIWGPRYRAGQRINQPERHPFRHGSNSVMRMRHWNEVAIDLGDRSHSGSARRKSTRIQVGRISSFGLMEMSRQRLRTGVLEASTKPCPHCDGTGLMRTAASAGLSALRILEDEAARGRGERISLRAGKEAAVYVLNKKRSELADIEQRYGVMIEVIIDEASKAPG